MINQQMINQDRHQPLHCISVINQHESNHDD